jgi:hypothetical protein
MAYLELDREPIENEGPLVFIRLVFEKIDYTSHLSQWQQLNNKQDLLTIVTMKAIS